MAKVLDLVAWYCVAVFSTALVITLATVVIDVAEPGSAATTMASFPKWLAPLVGGNLIAALAGLIVIYVVDLVHVRGASDDAADPDGVWRQRLGIWSFGVALPYYFLVVRRSREKQAKAT